jgi:hypothetical protein
VQRIAAWVVVTHASIVIYSQQRALICLDPAPRTWHCRYVFDIASGTWTTGGLTGAPFTKRSVFAMAAIGR